jgi:hypothetical protein
MEKLSNNNRIEVFKLSVGEMEDILNSFGYGLRSVDCIAVDGWITDKKSVLMSDQGDDFSTFNTDWLSKDLLIDIKLAKYGKMIEENENILKPQRRDGPFFGAFIYELYARCRPCLWCLLY